MWSPTVTLGPAAATLPASLSSRCSACDGSSEAGSNDEPVRITPCSSAETVGPPSTVLASSAATEGSASATSASAGMTKPVTIAAMSGVPSGWPSVRLPAETLSGGPAVTVTATACTWPPAVTASPACARAPPAASEPAVSRANGASVSAVEPSEAGWAGSMPTVTSARRRPVPSTLTCAVPTMPSPATSSEIPAATARENAAGETAYRSVTCCCAGAVPMLSVTACGSLVSTLHPVGSACCAALTSDASAPVPRAARRRPSSPAGSAASWPICVPSQAAGGRAEAERAAHGGEHGRHRVGSVLLELLKDERQRGGDGGRGERSQARP